MVIATLNVMSLCQKYITFKLLDVIDMKILVSLCTSATTLLSFIVIITKQKRRRKTKMLFNLLFLITWTLQNLKAILPKEDEIELVLWCSLDRHKNNVCQNRQKQAQHYCPSSSKYLQHSHSAVIKTNLKEAYTPMYYAVKHSQ